MSASKLFTPVLRTKRGTAAESVATAKIFMNAPAHAEIPVYQGPTDMGEPQNPLSLGGDSQTTAKPVGQRNFLSCNGKIEY